MLLSYSVYDPVGAHRLYPISSFLYGFVFFLEYPSSRLALVCPFFRLGILLSC